jgi:hypothetical protein
VVRLVNNVGTRAVFLTFDIGFEFASFARLDPVDDGFETQNHFVLSKCRANAECGETITHCYPHPQRRVQAHIMNIHMHSLNGDARVGDSVDSVRNPRMSEFLSNCILAASLSAHADIGRIKSATIDSLFTLLTSYHILIISIKNGQHFSSHIAPQLPSRAGYAGPIRQGTYAHQLGSRHRYMIHRSFL